MRFHRFWRLGAASLFMVLALAALGRGPGSAALPAAGLLQNGTPTPRYTCDQATPAADGTMSGMDTGSPMAGTEMEIEFDQLYIDMMVPHHAGIVALAQAALPRLGDPRLQAIARSIIEAQSAEIEELMGYRERFYGSPEPMPMDDHMMGMIMGAMPGMSSMEEMAAQMDPETQVAALCAATEPDLGFIDLVIPHHERAIAASEPARDRAVHSEIRAIAERVIRDQQREIAELRDIRQERHTSP